MAAAAQQWRWRAVLLALFLPVAGCRDQEAVRTSLNIQVGGRSVTATIDQSASINSQGGVVFIRFDGHSIAVEKERLLLDGRERARIPASARQVDLSYLEGRLSVRVDGQAAEVDTR